MTQPSGLPPEVIRTLKLTPARAVGSVVGELFFCDPYCESLGKVISANPELYQDGFKYQGSALPKASGKLRVLVDPIEKGQMNAEQEHEAESVSSYEEGSSLLTRYKTRWLFGFGLDLQLGARSLSTSSNTDTQTDAKMHGILGANINLEARDFGTLWNGLVSAKIQAMYWDSLSEQSANATPGRISSTAAGEFLTSFLWKKKPTSKWSFGLLLDVQERSFTTDPSTAEAFPSQYLFVSPGVDFIFKSTELQIIRSVFSSVTDTSDYRGTSVASTLLQFNLRSCKGLGDVLGGLFSICGIANLDLMSTTGSGTPLQSVFTSNPTYSSTEWRLGAEFSLAEIEL